MIFAYLNVYNFFNRKSVKKQYIYIYIYIYIFDIFYSIKNLNNLTINYKKVKK